MIGADILSSLVQTAADAVLAIAPLAALFLLFQRYLLKLPRPAFLRILLGLGIAAAGLLLFLFGVAVAYIPFGRALGTALATVEGDWIIAVIGLLLGLVTAFGEPAVRILADQVEDASSGSVRKGMVLLAVCAGVSAAVAIGLLRIVHGVPLLWLVVPGYGIAAVLLWLTDRDFAAIAVDAGGVATGPLANTFLLAVALGVAAGLGEDPLASGLGLASLIALAPILSVMALGVIVRRKKRHQGEER